MYKKIIGLCTIGFVAWAGVELTFNVVALQKWLYFAMPTLGLGLVLPMLWSMLKMGEGKGDVEAEAGGVTPIFKHGLIALMGCCTAILLIMGSGTGNGYSWMFPFVAMYGVMGLVRVRKMEGAVNRVTPVVLSTLVVIPVTLIAIAFLFLSVLMGFSLPQERISAVAEPGSQVGVGREIVMYSVDSGALGMDFFCAAEKSYFNLFALTRRIDLLDQPVPLEWISDDRVKIGNETYTVPWLP